MNKNGIKALFNVIVEALERLEKGQEKLRSENTRLHELVNQQLNQSAAAISGMSKIREDLLLQRDHLEALEDALGAIRLSYLAPDTGEEPSEAPTPHHGFRVISDEELAEDPAWVFAEVYSDSVDEQQRRQHHPSNPNSPDHERWQQLLHARRVAYYLYQHYRVHPRTRDVGRLRARLTKTNAWSAEGGNMTDSWFGNLKHASISWINGSPRINVSQKAVERFLAAARELIGEEAVDAQARQTTTRQAA